MAEGWSVGVVDDLSSGRPENVPAGVELLQADVRSPEARDFFFRFKPEAVAHLAAQASVAKSVTDPGLDAAINIEGTLAVAAACREAGVSRLVLASSAAVYGAPAYLPVDEAHPTVPLSPYGVSKLAAEHYVRVLSELAGASWVVLRYGNVYGPRQDALGEAGVVAVFVSKLVAGEAFPVHGDGQQSRDFVYVQDVAAATARAMAVEAAGGNVLNVAAGSATTVLELARALWAAAGRSGQPRLAFGEVRPGDIRHSRLDPGRAERVLGWRPAVGLEAGLRQTLLWWQKVSAVREGAG